MSTMLAMLLERPGSPLRLAEVRRPNPAAGEVLVEVAACGVCRTDLHVADGDLANPKLPLILGHEIVGRVAGLGAGVTGFTQGERVGIPWLGHTCGVCTYCLAGVRKPLRCAGIHGIHAGRRLCPIRGCRRRLLLPTARRPA